MSPSLVSLLSFASVTVAHQGLKAIPIGQPQPVGTLITLPSASPQKIDYVGQNDSSPFSDYHTMINENDDDIENNIVERNDDVPDDFGLYVPVGEEDGMTLVKPSLTKRASTFRGTMMMDCKRSLEACQNACWYQNCVKGAQGDPTKAPYTYNYSPDNDVNRVEAGTKLEVGTPCQNWPFGQRMWDLYPWNNRDKSRPSQRTLDTDEWPMADWDNTKFENKQDPVSLRCITKRDNTRGATEWTNFRDKAGEKYKTGGIYDGKRPAGKFVTGDTFNVDFDMSGFDDNDPNDVAMKNDLLYYCIAPFANCQNDGRQFHMTNLVKTTTRRLNVGTWRWSPYDPATMTSYTIDGESDVMGSIFVNVEITNPDQFSAAVATYYNGAYQDLADSTATVTNTGDSMTVSGGNLPKDLKITRLAGTGCQTELDFLYGDPATDGSRWFSFKSTTKSIKPDNTWGNSGKYCKVSDITDIQGQTTGTKFECVFPGW